MNPQLPLWLTNGEYHRVIRTLTLNLHLRAHKEVWLENTSNVAITTHNSVGGELLVLHESYKEPHQQWLTPKRLWTPEHFVPVKMPDPRSDMYAWWKERCAPEAWPTRQRALEFLKEQGVPTIPFGKVKTMPNEKLVIYTSDAHAGEGKIVMKKEEAMPAYRNNLASVKIGTEGLSLRYLAIGRQRWLMRYASNAWASNLGDEGSISSMILPPTKLPLYPNWDTGIHSQLQPIWAIDFVIPKESPLLEWLQMTWPQTTEDMWQADIRAGQHHGIPYTEPNWTRVWERRWTKALWTMNNRPEQPPAMLAVDLNLAPGIQGTQLHQSLGGSIIEALLTDAKKRQSLSPWLNPNPFIPSVSTQPQNQGEP